MTSGRAENVVVRGLAAGGAGVADLADGRVVFIQRTAPGDRVRIRIDKSKARWAVGSVVKMLDASEDRVEPPCSLYRTCGGCHLQHIPYEGQLQAKGQIIADALGRIGGVGEIEVPEVVASPEQLGYRNRVTYTLRRLKGGYTPAGFHALGRPGHVIDVAGQCKLPDETLKRAWFDVRSVWGEGAARLPDGGRLQLTLRRAGDGVALVINGGAAGWNGDDFSSALPGMVAIYHIPDDAEEAVLVSGSPVEGGGVAFEQVNPGAARLLRDHVLDVVATLGEPGTVIDAYCGTGEYGRALASAGWQATGIESDAQAAAAASGVDGFRVIHGRVESVLADLLPVDLLLVNPPRAGLHADVPALVTADPPAHLLYVSCDPGTLARDVRALGARYDIVSVRGFDLFPQTAHVETVVLLKAREADA